MASYNINHLPVDKLDKQFLLWMGDHALPVLVVHREIFHDSDESMEKAVQKDEVLANRIRHFVEIYEHRSWVSWNYADYQVYNYLTTEKVFKWKKPDDTDNQ
jgi:hypothetical protein